MKKKKHIDSFLLSKDKKHKYYYKKNSKSKITKNNFNTNFNKELNFYYGLQAIESGFLYIRSIKATLKLIKWFLRKYNLNKVKYKINFFPDFSLTAQGKETRMGKGKGDFSEKIALIKKNKVLFEFSKPKTISEKAMLLKLIKDCQIKLNLKTKLKKNIW